MLLAAMLVFFMQPGFALVEAGFTRTKNTANILMKNLLDFSLGSLLFWAVGFGIMFGSGGFIGSVLPFDISFFKSDLPTEGFLIFQTVFCATSATIVAGAMAERTKFSMYIAYTIVVSAVIYPISGHWTWGGGWLMNGEEGSFMANTFGSGFHDFAGSTVVHAVGGWLALVGAAIVGPRIGKYKDKKTRAIPGHNLTLATLGVFVLWFGWFGFNPGSQLAASGEENRVAISHVFLTTNLSACAGGLATLIDLLSKRFIVFEIDAIKDNKELFPVVTIIIMEAFINKMRRLKGVRKQLIVEEAWKALSSANMAEYLRYMYKTVRKYFGEAIVVTQEVDDIISSPVVKESIINNSDCKILLDQRKFMNRFDAIQSLLGLTDKERSQILSINMSNHPGRLYKEVWIDPLFFVD